MTVKELISKLSMLPEDSEVIINCAEIQEAEIEGDISIQTNDEDAKSPVYIEFNLNHIVAPIDTWYKNKYFDVINYKNSCYEQLYHDMLSDGRQNTWKAEQKSCGGWDERVGWALNDFATEQLYTWLNIYYEHAKGFIDLTFHKFKIDDTDDVYTEEYIILKIIELFKDWLINNDDWTDKEKHDKAWKNVQEGYRLLGIVLPSLWW